MEKRHKKEMNGLMIKFALANKKLNIGDIASDGTRSIRVDKFKYTCYGKYPEVVYIGQTLKKDGTPTKKIQEDSIYQTYLK